MLWELTYPSVTHSYTTSPDRWPTTQTRHTGICKAEKAQKGWFSLEQEGLRKQNEKRKDEHLFDNILFLVASKRERIKETPIKTPFIKHTTFRCLWWRGRGTDWEMGASVGQWAQKNFFFSFFLKSVLIENRALPLLLPFPRSVCVYVRTQQAGSSPRTQMLSVNTKIPERKQGFTAASCTHSQDLQRPGARREQPASYKHRPPCLLSEPLVLLPPAAWPWLRVS